MQESVQEEPKKKKGFKAWWAAHKPTKRRLIQLYAALLVNANIKGFLTGRIYTGETKNFCIPGMNCYSCPGAVGACPMGALQNALASSDTRAPYYVFGIIILFGLLLGRTICGFLCPIGLGQDLLYKIKTPKLKKNRFTRLFSYLKYVILAVFVIAIPVMYSLQMATVPGFCKYICPAGSFGGALSLLIHPNNADMYGMLGPIFTWKFCLMITIMVACVFIYRSFCRFICPLGAIYGFFNKVALLGVKLDRNKCNDCGLCVSHCKMDIKHVGDHECINCGECIKVCPAKAISWKGSKLFVHENAVPAGAPSEEKPLIEMLNLNSEVKEEIAVSETNSTLPVQEGNPEPQAQKPKKPGKGRNFWLQVGAWSLALVVLVGSLVYYNFLEDKLKDTAGNNPGGTDIVDNSFGLIEPTDGESYGNKVGELCYNFKLQTYATKATNFKDGTFELKEHRGEVVILNFWYTACGPCVAEMPDINKIAEEYEVTVIAIHSAAITTKPKTMEGVQTWLEDKQDGDESGWKDYSIIFGQDTGKSITDSVVYAALGGKGDYPMSLLVDTEGVIKAVVKGSLSETSKSEANVTFFSTLREIAKKR